MVQALIRIISRQEYFSPIGSSKVETMSRNRGLEARLRRKTTASNAQLKINFAVPTDPRLLQPPTDEDCVYSNGICKTHSVALPSVDRTWTITGVRLDETGQTATEEVLAYAYDCREAQEHLAKMWPCPSMPRDKLRIVAP